jgi:tetratricopeptide (TPR) repeat protein
MKNIFKLTIFLVMTLAGATVFAQENKASALDEGVAFYNGGKYAEAEAALGKLVETDGKNRKAWLYLGMSRARLKKNSEAVKAFQKADQIEGGTPEPGALKITRKPRVNYTDAARGNQTQGTVKLAVEFGADGKILAVVPFQKLPDGLTENSVAAAKKIVFEPAYKDGKAIPTIGIVSYSFTIY